MELWEKAILAAAFGFVDADGNREYREVIIIVGKKNGKSLISSAVGLYMFIADGEPGPEVYSVATKKDQAKIIWIEAKRMVLKSPALRKRIKCHVPIWMPATTTMESLSRKHPTAIHWTG